MRVERLDLTRFGHFTDHVLDFGTPRAAGDLHIVHGANEAGKSTTLEALTDLLFGVPLRSPHNFLHEYRTMELGARLHQNGETLEVRRFKNALTDAAGERLDGTAIDVHGLTRESFRTRFSFDTAMLEEGGKAILASRGDLGEALFSASAGLPDIHARLDEAMAESDRFYEPRKSRDKLLPALLEELRDVEEAIRSSDVQASEWRRLREQASALKTRWDEGERTLAAERRRQLTHQRELGAFTAKTHLTRARDALAALGELPDTPPAWLPRLRELQPRHTVLADGLRRTRDLRDKLAVQRDALVVDTALLARAERIDTLAAQRVSERERAAQLAELDPIIATQRHDIDAARRGIDAPPDLALDVLLPPTERLRHLERLASEHATLDSALASARAEHRALVARDAALHDAATDARDPVPLASLVRHVRERAASAALDVLERQARGSARELDAALDALAPWRGDVDALVAFTPPGADALAATRTALDKAIAERLRLDEEQRALSGTLTALARERDSLGVDERLDDTHASAARERRDAAWRAHTDALDDDDGDGETRQRTARVFAEALAADDAIGDERLRASDRLATLRGLTIEIAEKTALDRALASARAAADDTLADARRGLATQAEALGLDATASADDIERWLVARESALAARQRHLEHVAELDAARARRDELSSRLHAALSALASADSGGGVEDVGDSAMPLPGAALDEQLAFADARLRALDEAAERQRARHAERERIAAERRQRERTLRDREDDMSAWRARWLEALSTHWLGTREAADVIAMLPALRDLETRLDKHAESVATRTRLIDERSRYLGDVKALLDTSPPTTGGEIATPSDDTAMDAILLRLDDLVERLDAARRTAEERERLVTAHRESEHELERLERESAPLTAELDSMCAPFAVATLTELDAALEKARERRRLVDELAEAERGLVDALGAASVDEALSRLDTLDRDALEGDLAQLARTITHRQEEVGEYRLDARRAQDALDAVSGEGTTARLIERRANLLLEIRERAENTLRMRLGREAVLEGVRRYRDIHRGSLLHGARDAFVTLTGGRYTDLQTRPDDKGNDQLRAVDNAGRSLETAQLSDGTRFQLYLALRIAAYHDYARHRTPLPFVADDVMESFDETRTGAAIGLLRRMARKGQVIYLTHHRRVVEIAREIAGDAIRVHELPERR